MLASGVDVRVLLVDDSPDADRIAGRLREADPDATLRVTVERDPEAVPDRLDDVDCVVTAYDFPDTDGIDLARSVAARDRSVPVVLFPEHGDEGVAAAALSAGVADYVPRDPDTSSPGDDDPCRRLVDCIVRAVGDRRSRSDAEVAAARFRSLAENIPDAVVVVDEDARIRYVNPAVERVFGYSPDAIRGDPVSVLFPDAEVPDRGAAGGDPPSGRGDDLEMAGRHREGHEVDVEVSTGRFTDDGDLFFPWIIRPASG